MMRKKFWFKTLACCMSGSSVYFLPSAEEGDSKSDSSFPFKSPATVLRASNSGAVGTLFFDSMESQKRSIGVKPDKEAALVIFSNRIYEHLGFPTASYRLADEFLTSTIRERVTDTPIAEIKGRRDTAFSLQGIMATRLGIYDNPKKYPIILMDVLDGKDVAETLKDSMEHDLLNDPDAFRQMGRLMAYKFFTQDTDCFPLTRRMGNLAKKFPLSSNLGNIMVVRDPESHKPVVYSIDSKLGHKKSDGPAYFNRVACFLDLYFMNTEKTVPQETPMNASLKLVIKDHFLSQDLVLEDDSIDLIHSLISKHVPVFLENEVEEQLPKLLQNISPAILTDANALERLLLKELSGFSKEVLFNRFIEDCKEAGPEIALGEAHLNALEQGFLAGLHTLAQIQKSDLACLTDGLTHLEKADAFSEYLEVTVPLLLDKLNQLDQQGRLHVGDQ